jgi:very-short-patch-repair endonuclease
VERTEAWKRIAAFARSHHGLITARFALEAGMSRSAVEKRVASRRWIPLAKGVYAIDTSPQTWHRSVMAGVLSVGDSAVRFRTAAALHGIGAFRRTQVPEVVTFHTASARSRAAHVMRSQKYPVMKQGTVDQIPVLAPVEMVFNMAVSTSAERLERMIDEILVRRIGTVDDLAEVYQRYDGTRLKGIRRLRPIVLERISDAFVPNESELEFLLDELLNDPRVPAVVKQHRPTWTAVPARVDRWIPSWRLIVEADGRAWHSRSSDFERDRARDNAAAAADVAVLRFTHRMLRDDMTQCRAQVVQVGRHRVSASDRRSG